MQQFLNKFWSVNTVLQKRKKIHLKIKTHLLLSIKNIIFKPKFIKRIVSFLFINFQSGLNPKFVSFNIIHSIEIPRERIGPV